MREHIKKIIAIIKRILYRLSTPDELREHTPLTDEQYLNLLRIIKK